MVSGDVDGCPSVERGKGLSYRNVRLVTGEASWMQSGCGGNGEKRPTLRDYGVLQSTNLAASISQHMPVFGGNGRVVDIIRATALQK